MLCALLLGAAALPARGTDYNWNGQNSGALGNFSYCDNWYYVTCPTWAFGNNIHFSYNDNGETTGYNDLNWPNISNIYWDSSYPAALTWNNYPGYGINFDQRIENDSTNSQTWNIPVSGDKNNAGHIELNPVNGDLTLTQPVYNDNAVEYQVWGGNSKMLTVSADLVGGVAGKSAVMLTIEQYSKVKLTAAQTWGDGTAWCKYQPGGIVDGCGREPGERQRAHYCWPERREYSQAMALGRDRRPDLN